MGLTAAVVAVLAGVASAGETPADRPPAERPSAIHHDAFHVHETDTLTDEWFGTGRVFQERGFSLKLTTTQVYQDVARGGLATRRHKGRYAGSYDLEFEADMDKVAGLRGGTVYALAEGGWSDGIDPPSLGSLGGANGDAIGALSLRLSELHYTQSFLDDRIRLRAGKIDLTGGIECRGCLVAFDSNAFANNEISQFINGAMVNNPSIPFPEQGIGALAVVQPLEWWYVAAGIGDAQADARETGFNTAFRGRDYSLSLVETGALVDLPSARGPLHGAYRVGLWYDPQPKARFDGRGDQRDDAGLYGSFDQVLVKENEDPKDVQGLGAFARFGFADRRVNPVRFFWSAGAQYAGPISGRDADVLGIGLARSRLADDPGAGFTAAHETVVEAYYRIAVMRWLHVSPHVQFIANPGGLREVRDATVVGVRVQAAF